MAAEKTSIGSTQDDRIMAALAHASVIIPFWGMIGAVVIWATQREKSRFVGFQALQALVYQLSLILLGAFGFACYMCSFPVMMLSIPGFASMQGPRGMGGGILSLLISTIPFCIMGLVMLLGFAFVIYGFYGAARVLQGEDFRYAIVGSRLEAYLNKEDTGT
ncbi:MAG TPA: DUF4870 domain-containing protein [Chloroflexi bacterium]|nr:DUF4870 domain-containing protein [Chloroflexota bacterium]